jgi:hypothetical protein
VADGAVYWALKGSVTVRRTRYSFGTDVLVRYDEVKHSGRQIVNTAAGLQMVDGNWSQIVAKVSDELKQPTNKLLTEYQIGYFDDLRPEHQT